MKVSFLSEYKLSGAEEYRGKGYRAVPDTVPENS